MNHHVLNRLLLLTVLLVVVSVEGGSATPLYSLPTDEYNALFDLYNSTHGNSWVWVPSSFATGYPWTFTSSPPENPCSPSHFWQGLTCSSTCEQQPCHITGIQLINFNLTGPLPSTLGSLKHLEFLKLAENRLTGSVPDSVLIWGNWTVLTKLDLSQNQLTGTLPKSFHRLSSIDTLSLSVNAFTGTIPSQWGLLNTLLSLELDQNYLTGAIPSNAMTNLTALQTLTLNENQLTGTIPTTLGELHALETLLLDQNELTGILPDSLGKLSQSLQYIDVFQNGLTGSLPKSYGNLTQLEDFIGNLNYFTSTLPSSFGELHNLINLQLDQNLLSGSIPACWTDLHTLINLYLQENILNGIISSEMRKLISLKFLALQQNHLSGSIPVTLGQLSSLKGLYLYQNKLTGTIPSNISALQQLVDLELNENRLTGSIPSSLGNMSRLHRLYLYQNQLSGTLPDTWSNLTALKDLHLYDNLFTGTIPMSLGNLSSLVNLYLDKNEFSGSIPLSLYDIQSLKNIFVEENQLTGTLSEAIGHWKNVRGLYCDMNYLSGSIPTSIGQLELMTVLLLHSNYLSGDIPSSMGNLTFLTTFYLFDNLLSGTLPTTLSKLTVMEEIDVSYNHHEGSIPDELFENITVLQAISLNNNGFTGSIPRVLFQSTVLLSSVLAINCFTGILPDSVCNSPILNHLILDGLHSASTCSEKAIPGLPSSGLIAKSSVHGHIPSCLLQHKHLSVLHLGGNSFSGSIPNVPISAAMTELVLSSNQLTGSIPDSIWQSNITKLDLSLNRLQGTLPSDMLPAAQIQLQSKILASGGNSTVSVKLQVNQLAGTIPTWLQSLPVSDIDVLEGNLFSCNADRSDLPANDPKAATYECGSDNTNYGLITFGAALVCVLLVAGAYWYCITGVKPVSAVAMVVSFKKHYADSEVEKQWEHIQGTMFVIVGMWMLGILVYGLLSLQFSSYANVYVWAVSGIYKDGVVAGVVEFFFLGVGLCIIVSWNAFSAVSVWQEPKTQASVGSPSETKMERSQYLLYAVIIIVDITVVLCINGLYISAIVSSKYTSQTLLGISFLLSLFKLACNYLLARVSIISDKTILLLCLFNNLLAPLLAEMFVSSDCFLYIVTQAPALQFNYEVYTCQWEDPNNRDILLVCDLPLLYSQGLGTSVTSAITPPFHYSYQCSFSLISSYVSVFIFRYIVSAIVEPILRLCLYCVATQYNITNRLWTLGMKGLTPFWRSLVHLHNFIDNVEMFGNHLNSFEKQIRKGKFQRRIVVLLVTDLTMLICFGALFPPLAVIIALSVLKDVMSIRLALGRYCEIMEAVQGERLKERMVKVRESMDEEMLKAGAGIWNGVWYGMVMGTWIWGFVLFDTMASVGGVGKGVGVLLGMILFPNVIFVVTSRLREKVLLSLDVNAGVATNPMVIDVEMKRFT